MRLEHLLMKHLVLSRREMKKLIKNEAVLIDEVPATHVSNNVDATLQVITVDGTCLLYTSTVLLIHFMILPPPYHPFYYSKLPSKILLK